MDFKNNKAITLIALVITIVVLLILATITLNLTLGEDGIIAKAKQAVIMQKKAQYFEEINIEIVAEQLDRLRESKQETFIESLQDRLEGTPTASLDTQAIYAKKAWIKSTLINLDRILVIYTVEDYQILVEVDNEGNTAKIIEDSFTKKGKDCTVTFNGNSGEGNIDSITIPEGLYIKLPINTFTKNNYTFVGWYKDAEEDGERYNPGEEYRVTEDETLYARWSQHAISITYNAGGGTGEQMPDTTIEIGKKDNLLENTYTRLGYSFAGWKDQYNNDYTNGQEVTAEKDLTLTAQWSPIEYLISYDLDGGELESGKTNPDKYTIESAAITLNNPKKSTYSFTGWSGTDLNGNNNMTVTIPQGSIGNRTFSAHWRLNGYTISYDNNGGNGTMESHTGTSLTVKTNEFTPPTGKKFKVWNTLSNGQGTDYTQGQNVELSSNIKLYAIWESSSLVDYWPLLTSLNSGMANESALVVSIGNNYNFTSGCLRLTDTALSTSSNYSLPSNFTVSVKYKPETLTAWTMIVGKITNYNNLNTYNGIFVHSNTATTRLCNGTNSPNSFDISNILEIGKWSTLTFTYNGTKSKLYKDGNLVTEQTGYYDLSAKLYLGGSMYSLGTSGGPNWRCANGYYKEFRIYNKALTQEEIRELN